MTHSKHLEAVIFDGAAALSDSDERAKFLDQTCSGNPELRVRIETLLAVDQAAIGFFTLPRPSTRPGELVPSKEDPSEAETIGTDIGRYRLIERMGEGGCGVVYLAEQHHPVRRKVALKIVRLGMDTENVIARFEMERQSLALMDHPNIARVLDAGATVTGRPYFVMELVDGDPVTDFCDRQRLSIRERLELFIRICLAIQHAHQKGVIHRDIKPSNVLVRVHDGVAQPKVIDFGIAKATAGRSEGDTAFTGMGQFIGTPAYMSPEQAEGGGMNVDTRSDIYSLGGLLYELLTGRPPFDPKRLKQCGHEMIRQILREEEPQVPSARMATLTPPELKELSLKRGGITDSQKLPQKLRGDLDWIVMKAMEKDRRLRYETANGLAMDVRRHLDSEPVIASPPGRLYRLRKLVRRNQVTFLAGSVAVIGLLAAMGVSTKLYFREREVSVEQARLRAMAEAARANEATLRQAAERRGLVSQAAVLIGYGNLPEADRLLALIPPGDTPSSLEAANSYKTVADWHFFAGHPGEAARRYSSMAHAISEVDPGDNDGISRYFLPAAAALCLSGNRGEYERIRGLALDRFVNTTHPVVAEQVLKTCLLLPADETILGKLRPLEKIVGAAIDQKDSAVANNQNLAAWSCFALALAAYRNGDDASSLSWANRGLAFELDSPARIASTRILLAMIDHRAGRTASARELLDLAAAPVMENTESLIELRKEKGGYWFDWVNARVLHREAAALLGE